MSGVSDVSQRQMGNTNTVLYVFVLIVSVLILLLCWATQRKLKTLEWYMVDIYDSVNMPIVVVPESEAADADAAAADASTTGPVSGATAQFPNKKLSTVIKRPGASKLKASGEMCNRIFGPSKVANVTCGIDAKHIGAGAPLNKSGEMCNRIFGPTTVANTTCGITASLNQSGAALHKSREMCDTHTAPTTPLSPTEAKLPKPHVGASLDEPHVGLDMQLTPPLHQQRSSGVPSINQSIMGNYRSDRRI